VNSYDAEKVSLDLCQTIGQGSRLMPGADSNALAIHSALSNSSWQLYLVSAFIFYQDQLCMPLRFKRVAVISCKVPCSCCSGTEELLYDVVTWQHWTGV